MRVYLDNNASTQMDGRVFASMTPYFCSQYGNPSNATHFWGQESNLAVRKAKETIASGLNAASLNDIIFTSGATESNNLALFGICGGFRGKHLIVSEIEHPSILEPCRKLEKSGLTVTYLKVGCNGIVGIDQLEEAIRPDTILISVMGANNEIGTIQPIEEIGKIAKKRGILFHCDATQLAYWQKLDVSNIDLLSMSAHKLHGPKGNGILYANQRARSMMRPMIFGGGQQQGLRSGTLDVAGIVGMAKALEIAWNEQETYRLGVRKLRDTFIEMLSVLPISINGDESNRVPGNLNVVLNGVSAEKIMSQLPNIAFSAGSACMSELGKRSYVLSAIGRTESEVNQSIRIGISKMNTIEEIEYAARQILRMCKKGER